MRTDTDLEYAFDRYADTVKRICYTYLKNKEDTEDIFQNVFLKYALYEGSFESSEHEKAWFLRVAINECKDLLKSFFHKHVSPMEAMDELSHDPFNKHNTDLMDALFKLPEKYRIVIYLFYYEGYSAIEIAEILCKNDNTIYTWLSRAKKLLKDELGGIDFE